MKSNILLGIALGILVVSFNLFTMIGNSGFLLTKVSDYAESQIKLRNFSTALELYSHGYKIRSQKKFKVGIGVSQKRILEASIILHSDGNFSQAQKGYKEILKSVLVENQLLEDEAKRFEGYAANNYSELELLRLADSFQLKNPIKAFEMYSDCLRIYPDLKNKGTVEDKILKLAARFLQRTRAQHQEGEFTQAIKSYQKIIMIPCLSENLKLEATQGLSLAQQQKRFDFKVAFLTFDDGPSTNTLKILDILRKYNIKATFFVTGNNSEFGANVYRKIISEGHVLGNHTYSHIYKKIYVSVDSFMEDFLQLEELLHERVGIRPKIYRFPGGSNNLVSQTTGGKKLMDLLIHTLNAKGYQYFDWNVNSQDAEVILQDTQVIIDSVLSSSQDKEKIIVLMHDTIAKKTTPEALPEIIEGLREQGFTFDTLP